MIAADIRQYAPIDVYYRIDGRFYLLICIFCTPWPSDLSVPPAFGRALAKKGPYCATFSIDIFGTAGVAVTRTAMSWAFHHTVQSTARARPQDSFLPLDSWHTVRGGLAQ